MTRVEDRLQAPADLSDAVLPAEYTRLLGYPPDRALNGAVAALAETSRGWFRHHGRPWIFGRTAALRLVDDRTIELENGTRLESRVLTGRLREAEAPALVAVTVSAGPEVDARVDALWAADRPDEAFFLDRFGVAVAEHLAAWCGETLRSPDTDDLVALPGYSPGYAGWDLGQQRRLFDLITEGSDRPLPGPLEVLDSGMLTPRSSLLAVFGLTPRRRLAQRSWAKHRCDWCSLVTCGLRRSVDPEPGDSRPVSG